MDRDTVIRLAREAGAHEKHQIAYMDFDDLERFAALVEQRLKSIGYRQCAKGQRTTQFCGMVEQAVKAEREECAKVFDNAPKLVPFGKGKDGGCIMCGFNSEKAAAAIRSRK